ncbi:ABC transporter permease [soil metagenome]
MITELRVEVLKLKRSLVLPLALAAPLITASLFYLIFNRMGTGVGRMGAAPMPWTLYADLPLRLWSFFMLPMAITGLVIITSQVEHGPKAWNYILSLPTARWRIFLAKAIIVLGLTALMSVVLYLLLPLSGWIRGFNHKPMIGTFDWQAVGLTVARIYGAGVLLAVIQIWASLRFRNVAAALAVGIGGGVVSIAALFAAMIGGGGEPGAAVYFPWLMPTFARGIDAASHQALGLGLGVGLVALVAMIVDLSRREVA